MTQREVEEKTTLTRKITVYICDICGDEHKVALNNCFICGREVCAKHIVYMPDNDMWWHDYEAWCCDECWSIGEKHRTFLDEEERKFREVVASNIALWKIKALIERNKEDES